MIIPTAHSLGYIYIYIYRMHGLHFKVQCIRMLLTAKPWSFEWAHLLQLSDYVCPHLSMAFSRLVVTRLSCFNLGFMEDRKPWNNKHSRMRAIVALVGRLISWQTGNVSHAENWTVWQRGCMSGGFVCLYVLRARQHLCLLNVCYSV